MNWETKPVLTTTVNFKSTLDVAQQILSSIGIRSYIDEMDVSLDRDYRLLSLSVEKGFFHDAIEILTRYNIAGKA